MRHRLALIFPACVAIYAACYYGAYLLRFDFQIGAPATDLIVSTLPAILLIKCLTCLATGELRRSFRYATLSDLLVVATASTASAAAILLANFTLFPAFSSTIPRSVIVIDWMLATAAMGGLRILPRIFAESIQPLFSKIEKPRTLIFGTSAEGIAILRAMQAVDSKFEVVGLVSDRAVKERSLIAGLPIYSTQSKWAKLARKSGAGHVLIPGSLSGRRVREITRGCHEAGLKAYVIPAVSELMGGRYNLTIRDVSIADLLRREPAQLDFEAIRSYVTGRRVLVTGGAGSIGSELCRQILELRPASLVLVDQSELGMFTIEREFAAREPVETPLTFLIRDIANRGSIERVFNEHKPQLVFHAAAYKHVPLMEDNPGEAIRNNVGGTQTVVDVSHAHGVERFVMISTDKAVRPTSVMGCTKLVAEKYVQAVSTESQTQFVTVRFGNVLNSAGSVVPTFRRQIEQGGPVTVTHPEMTRFFMTIPEAVQLVLQAGAVGSSGDILILEMGEPVKIVDLARDMISLSGLKHPGDIEIEFTGLRPGEKLYEELFYSSEEGTCKVHDKIFRASRSDALAAPQVKTDVAALLADPHVAGLWEFVNRSVAADEQVTPKHRRAAA